MIIAAILMGIFSACAINTKDRKCDILRQDPLLFSEEDYIVLVVDDHSGQMKLCLVKFDANYQTNIELDKIVDLSPPLDDRKITYGTDSTKIYIGDRKILLHMEKCPDTLKVNFDIKARNFSWDDYFTYYDKGKWIKFVDVEKKKFFLPFYYTPDLIQNKDGLIYIRHSRKRCVTEFILTVNVNIPVMGIITSTCHRRIVWST